MRKIAILYSGNYVHHKTFYDPRFKKYIASHIYLPELASTTLDEFDVLYVPSQLNGHLLLQSKEKIINFAENGGIVAVFGPQPWTWIPNQNWEERPTNFWWWLEKDAKSGLNLVNPDYHLFHYITLADATWHHHGVYWPIEGCEVLIATDDGGAIFYVDQVSTKGTWIVATIDPDYHFGSYFMPATERFLLGFFPWLAEGKI